MPLVSYRQLLGKGSQEEKDEKGEAVLSNLVGLSGYYFAVGWVIRELGT
jgi:hypothetical protein